MACNRDVNILLGYEDEHITEKLRPYLSFATNKIGGTPDWYTAVPTDRLSCPLCCLPRPLVLQIYAPLDNRFNRTLYVFACISPNCWDQPDSWTCFRLQSKHTETVDAVVSSKQTASAMEWCQGADDWEDDNSNPREENGNIIEHEKVSDDDESCSFEDSLTAALGNVSIDNRSEPSAGSQEEAIGRQHSPCASAEIEGDEGEIVSIDAPLKPQRDLRALLQEATPLPRGFCQRTMTDVNKLPNLQFVPYFMSVYEESSRSEVSDDHVRELLQQYQRNEQMFSCPDDGAGDIDGVSEKYEKDTPAHGDRMFHHFLCQINKNPGQILRYGRGGDPLLLQPLHGTRLRCEHCDSDMLFEFQVLPTIISKLKLMGDNQEGSRLDFGTALVYTCQNSCWPADDDVVRKEAVVLQFEQ